MIVVLIVRLSMLGVEEVITSDELKDHAGKGPDVGRLVILCFKDDFWRAVLSGLDDVRVVSFCIARVTHVYDLYVKHHIADLLEVSALLRMQLHVHPLLASASTFTADAHTIIYFFLHLSPEIFESYFVAVRLSSKFLEIVGSMFLNELEIFSGWVREIHVGVTILTLLQDFMPGVLPSELSARNGAAIDWEDVICQEFLFFIPDFLAKLFLQLCGF